MTGDEIDVGADAVELGDDDEETLNYRSRVLRSAGEREKQAYTTGTVPPSSRPEPLSGPRVQVHDPRKAKTIRSERPTAAALAAAKKAASSAPPEDDDEEATRNARGDVSIPRPAPTGFESQAPPAPARSKLFPLALIAVVVLSFAVARLARPPKVAAPPAPPPAPVETVAAAAPPPAPVEPAPAPVETSAPAAPVASVQPTAIPTAAKPAAVAVKSQPAPTVTAVVETAPPPPPPPAPAATTSSRRLFGVEE